MRLRTFTTADIPAAWRFDAWRRTLSATHLDWDLVGSERDFDAQVSERTVGDLRLVGCRCAPCEGFRSARHVAHRDADDVGILFALSGSEIVRQGEREATLRPGDFVIWDSSQALEFRVLEPLHKLTILVPRATMRRFLPSIDGVAGMRVDGAESLGPLVGAHLRQLASGLGSLEDRHLRLVADTTLELVAAGVGAIRGLDPVAGAARYERVRAHIVERLSDPDLTPAAIAAANGISTRYLHKLFSARGQSVSRWILEQRLDRCRKSIETEGARSVTDIALSWGFNDGSHFSRSFRNAFGTTPRALRRAAQGAPPRE